MNETIKLYDQDAYATEFTARVISCVKVDAGVEVILNQTLFFPEEGGQSADQGTINGVEVLDVQINKGVITHLIKENIEEGTVVTGVINWKHRFSNMQNHTGEHIL